MIWILRQLLVQGMFAKTLHKTVKSISTPLVSNEKKYATCTKDQYRHAQAWFGGRHDATASTQRVKKQSDEGWKYDSSCLFVIDWTLFKNTNPKKSPANKQSSSDGHKKTQFAESCGKTLIHQRFCSVRVKRKNLDNQNHHRNFGTDFLCTEFWRSLKKSSVTE